MEDEHTEQLQGDLKELFALETARRTGRIVGGFALPFRAARILATTPSLWGWAILPALINVALFALIFAALFLNAGRLLDGVWARPEILAWYHWFLAGLWHLFLAILVLLSAALAYFLVLLLSGVVASPAQKKLSRQTERALTDRFVDVRHGEHPLVGGLRSVGTSLAILLIYLVIMAILLLLHLIPVVGSIAYTVLATAVSIYFLSLEYTDDTLERRGLLFRQKLAVLRRNIDLAGGFGAGLAILLFIPFVNLIAMPIAVVGGTMLGLALCRWSNQPPPDEPRP